MKYPKLSQPVLCQLTVGLPVILLILLPLLLVLFAGVTVWAFIGGMVLAAIYLLCNLTTLFTLDITLSALRSWTKERAEYITDQNGTTRSDISQAILSRCQSWGKQLPANPDGSMLFYVNRPSFTKFYSGYQFRAVVTSTKYIDPDTYQCYCSQAIQHIHQAPLVASGWWQSPDEKAQPICQVDVLILLADTIAPECKTLPYQASALRVCLVECATGKYYMNSELEAYEQGAMPKPVQNYQVQLLQKLVFDNHLPLDSSPSMLPAPALASPDDSLWQFLSNLRQALRQSDQEENEQAKAMLDTLTEDQIRIGDCVIYYKHQSRLYLCNFIPDDDDPKLILDPFPDCESIRYNKDKDKLIRHNCSDAEEARLMSAVHTWAAANGWRIESCDPEDDA